MAELVEVAGIVLSKRKYREKDYLIKIFTEDNGKMMFYVRGSKQPHLRMNSAIQPYSKAVFIADIRREGLSFYRDIKFLEAHNNIQTDIFKSAYVTHICSLIDASMADRIPNPQLFHQLDLALKEIDKGVDAEIIMNIFEVQLLRLFGTLPEFRGCVHCHNSQGPFDYSSKYNGLLCNRHFYLDERRLHASSKAIEMIRLFSVIKMEQLGNVSVKTETKKEIRRVIDLIYDELVGVRLKSKKFIDQLNQFGNLLRE